MTKLIVASFRKIKRAGFFIGVLSRCCFRLVGFNPRTTGLSTEKFQVSAQFSGVPKSGSPSALIPTLNEMSELAGGFEYSTVNAAIARFEKRLKIDQELQTQEGSQTLILRFDLSILSTFDSHFCLLPFYFSLSPAGLQSSISILEGVACNAQELQATPLQ